jgi:hypothetical protein
MKKLLFILAFGLSLLTVISSACTERKELTAEESIAFITRGDSISSLAFAALSNKLQIAIRDSGVLYAIPFCNLVAIPAMDSLSEVFGVEIKRTSLQLRNTANQPTETEQQVLEAYNNTLQAGGVLEERVLALSKQQALFTRPIMTMPLCLQCHGNPESDIQPEVYARIKALYPEDKAIGYTAGDWRGIWSITFDR